MVSLLFPVLVLAFAPPGQGPDLQQQFADLKRRIETKPAVDVSAERALQYARHYLAQAEDVYRAGHVPQARRISAACADLVHVADHQEHLQHGGGPIVPRREEIQNHMQRVYFRTQQADYFLAQAHDAAAGAFPEWSREFYQLALRAYDRKEWVAADENAKCAEELVKALENLAQAANLGHT